MNSNKWKIPFFTDIPLQWPRVLWHLVDLIWKWTVLSISNAPGSLMLSIIAMPETYGALADISKTTQFWYNCSLEYLRAISCWVFYITSNIRIITCEIFKIMVFAQYDFGCFSNNVRILHIKQTVPNIFKIQ